MNFHVFTIQSNKMTSLVLIVRICFVHTNKNIVFQQAKLQQICSLTNESKDFMFNSGFDFFFQLTTDEPKPQKKDIDTVKEVCCHKFFSGRVLDSRLKGFGFEPHRSHIVVSLRKSH